MQARERAIVWLARFGRRNVFYLAFVLADIALGMAIDATEPKDPNTGGIMIGGAFLAIVLWTIASAGFLLVNAILAIVAIANGRPAGTALIACALPMLVAIAVMVSGV